MDTTAFSAPSRPSAFAGWLENGPAMFMALAESGLAWCF